MNPTPEEIKQIAIECGAMPITMDDTTQCFKGEIVFGDEEELKAFATRMIEIGRKRALITVSRDLQAIHEDGSCLCASCAQYVARITGKAIRNNTGE